MRSCPVLLLLFFFFLPPLSALEYFPNARWVDFDSADGDSFLVEFDREGQLEQHVIRLYFVDCPETEAASDADRRRVLEQMRFFGLASPVEVYSGGQEAAEYVRQRLQEPFTVHTAFASALGRSRMSRVYAMVTTSDGQDLAADLVRNGWARATGMRRAMPDGTSAAEYAAYLSDLEAAAMLGNRGIWSGSDPDYLADLRAKERRDQRELAEAFGDTVGLPAPASVDINHASDSVLRSLPGIGPALAARIIAERPYSSVEELTRVPGISTATLDRISEFLILEEPTPSTVQE
jgi:competence protein ComEA